MKVERGKLDLHRGFRPRVTSQLLCKTKVDSAKARSSGGDKPPLRRKQR